MGLRFSRSSTLSKIGLLALLVLLDSIYVDAQQSKVLAPHDPIAPKVSKPIAMPPAVAASIAGGPWIVDANFRSILYLKNVVETSAVTVTPVLYLSNGTKYQLSPVQLEAAGIATVDINASLTNLGIAPYATLSGWVEVQYNWGWAPVCAMIRDIDVAHSVVFSFGFGASVPLSTQTQKSASLVVEGLWWKQEPNVTGFLALANTTSQPLTALVQISDNHAAVLGTHTITVSPQGMKTLNLQELQTAGAVEGGIRVSYVGQPDALLINGGLEDPGVGYSANLRFAAPTHPLPPMAHFLTQQGIAELGLMVGPADPMMRFPSGTTFTPYSVVRNITSTPISATPNLWWMQGGAPKSFQLPQVNLLPYETTSLDVPSLLAAAGLKSFSGSINLVFDTQGKAGLLMASGSVDQTNSYVFEVGARGIVKSAGKSISYWSTGNGDDTMVTLWNPADEAQSFTFRITFTGGHYDLPINLAPRETRMFNLSEIIATQVPDAQGNIIPASIQEGSAKIVGSQADHQHILVAVDSGVYNVRRATCYTSCYTCDGATAWTVALNPFGVAVSGQQQEYLVAQWNTGAQNSYTSQANWSSNNTSVATVNTGLVQAVSVGSMVISAGDSSEPVYANCAPYCPIMGGGGGSSSGTVTPHISGISPTTAMAGAKSQQLTISGSGFGTSPTVNLPSGVTKSTNTQQSSSDTQITITVDIAKNSTIGVNQVSVTAGGQTSNSVNFTVDGPYYLMVLTDKFFPNNDGFGNGMRRITYQIQNFSLSNVTSAIPVGETALSDTGWNCTNRTAPTVSPTLCGQGTSLSDGTLVDDWELESNVVLTPTGCGFSGSKTTWNWCDGATFTHELTVINGYIHTNAVSEFGIVNPPNSISPNTREPH